MPDFNWKKEILIGILIATLIIGLFIYWSLLIYKYNLDRLGNLAMIKFQIYNRDKIPDNVYLSYGNVKLSNDKSYIILDINLRNNRTTDIVKKYTATYYLSNCNTFMPNCLAI